MNAPYITAAVLAGSAIGGLTSLAASWLSGLVQSEVQRRAADLSRREELYKDFVEEASKWYADASENDNPRISNLVHVSALISRMRVLSSPRVVESAERVLRVIIETYLAPNRTFRDLKEFLDNNSVDPLQEFGNVCREELRGCDALGGANRRPTPGHDSTALLDTW